MSAVRCNEALRLDIMIKELNRLIQRGRQGEARQRLIEVSKRKVPRNQKAEIADLARRLNMPKMIIGLLKPLVYSAKTLDARATPAELALYATALSRLGAYQEAERVFAGISSDKSPQTLLFIAQHFMLQWNYKDALPKLRKYIAQPELSEYQRLVGEVNLASSLIGEMRWSEAEQTLSHLFSFFRHNWAADRSASEHESYELLYANALGLAAHACFFQGKTSEAAQFITDAKNLLKGSRSRYELLITKWQTILELFEKPGNSEDLDILKIEARKAKDWETVRDLDFFEALASRNDKLFLQLFHGTPYASYRKRIRAIYKPRFAIPKTFVWRLEPLGESDAGDLANTSDRCFDLSLGRELNGRLSLASKPLLMRLMESLTKDFYRPQPAGGLFSTLYPEERFNPDTSPNRVYLLIKRLRAWFESQFIPLGIEVADDKVKLYALESYSIRVSYRTLSVSKNDSLLASLSSSFLDRDFTIEQAQQLLGLKRSPANLVLKWGVQKARLRRFKRGAQYVYRFKSR